MAVTKPACGRASTIALAALLALGCSEGGGAESASEDARGCSAAGWEAGANATDIAPTAAQIATGKLYMGAYGILTQRGPATGVHDDVYARTLVLKSGCNVVSMTVLDMPGISNRVIHAIGDAVTAATKLPKENVYVGATHSHSTPDLQGLWGHVPDDYKNDVIEKTAHGIVSAYEALAPADLFVSKGTAPNHNRRGWPFTDTELTVLDARAKDGSHIGTLVNFAAHPVILGAENHDISRDFCGYTVDFIEKQLGGGDAGGGPVGLFFNGVVGDASPNATASAFDGCKEYGELVAQSALDSMNHQTKVSPGIYRDQETFTQEITNVGFIALGKAGDLDYDFERDGGTMSVETQFTYLRLGKELQTVVFPGEALTRTGLEIKAPETAPFHLWLGLTTDSLGYFVKSDEWMTGHNNNYEETVSMGETAGDNAIKAVTGLIAKDKGFYDATALDAGPDGKF